MRAVILALVVVALAALGYGRWRRPAPAPPAPLPAAPSPAGDGHVELTAVLGARAPAPSRPLDGIADLVAALPGEFRRNFTLVHRSRSPHGGLGDERESSIDARFPRAILHSENGRTVLAFTTDPDRPGFDVAEVLRFVDDGARFELLRFVLPAAVRRDPALGAVARHNGEVNPPECLRCHGLDPRPLFDSYPLWPGFFGAVADSFPEGSPELGAYRAFLAGRASSTVFPLLEWPTGTSVPPYLDPVDYHPDAREASPEAFRRSPNAQLGMALGELNRKRIERKLAASPLYGKYRHGLLAVLLECERPPLGTADLEPVRAALDADNAARGERLGFHPRGPGAGYLKMTETLWPWTVAEVLYVARALEVDPRDFSMSFEDGALGFYDGILSGIHDGRRYFVKQELIIEMMRRLARDEPEFAPFFVTYNATRGRYPFGEKPDLDAARVACRLLREGQRATGAALPALGGPLVDRPPAAADAPPPDERKAESAPPALLERCGRCHDGEDAVLIGRPIPFSRPELLGPRLQERAASSARSLAAEIVERMRSSGPERMPPHGAAPSAEAIDEMTRYLAAVQSRR